MQHINHQEEPELLAEDIAALQYAVASGQVSGLPLRLQIELEENSQLACALLENIDLEGLPNHLFDNEGLLNPEGIAIYVDAVRRGRLSTLHPALLAHAEFSALSAARVNEAILDNKHVDLALDKGKLGSQRRTDTQPESHFGAERGKRSNWPIFAAAGVAMLLFFMVWVLNEPPSESEAGAESSVAMENPGRHAPDATRTGPDSALAQLPPPQIPILDREAPVQQNASNAKHGPNPATRFGFPQGEAEQGQVAQHLPDKTATADLAYATRANDVRPQASHPTNALPQAASQGIPGSPPAAGNRAESSPAAQPYERLEIDNLDTGGNRPPRYRAGESQTPAHTHITRIYFARRRNGPFAKVPPKLMQRFKLGELAAYDFRNFGKPVGYSELEARLGNAIAHPDPLLELVENVAGQTLYIKLRWGGHTGESILFAYDNNTLSILEEIRVPHPRNEAATLSVKQLLDMKEYDGVAGQGPNQSVRPD